MVEVEALGIADVPGEFVTRALELAVLSYAGLEGDRHAGLTQRSGVRQKHLPKGTEIRNARQLSLVSVEELSKIAAALGLSHLDSRWLGANVLLRGAPALTAWAPGTRLVFGSGAVLVIDGENEPCRKAGRAIAAAAGADEGLAARFVKAAHRLRGLVAWVERPGTIRCGDPVTLVSR
ncbi:MAG: MOSC domain-containing protein [Archangium sp.]|nr:MOSC domain-containing protein [Archangium sp.]